jgi:hypothetical protein
VPFVCAVPLFNVAPAGNISVANGSRSSTVDRHRHRGELCPNVQHRIVNLTLIEGSPWFLPPKTNILLSMTVTAIPLRAVGIGFSFSFQESVAGS